MTTPTAPRTPIYYHLLAGGLIAVFLLQSFLNSLLKSPVYDEPPHIASGLSYLATGVFRANVQHPPLLKEMCALFLNAAGIHWPNTPEANAFIAGDPRGRQRRVVHRQRHHRVQSRPRPLLGAPALHLIGRIAGVADLWVGARLAGDAATLGAFFLYAPDPTLVAHSYLVTTDLGLAAFSVLFLWTAWRYIQQPSRRRMAICGRAMGAMLAAKFSAAFLLASGAVLMLAAIRLAVIGRRAGGSEGRTE